MKKTTPLLALLLPLAVCAVACDDDSTPGSGGGGTSGSSQAGQAGSSQAGQAGSSQAGQGGAGQAGSSQAGQAGAGQAGQAGESGQGGAGQGGDAGQGGGPAGGQGGAGPTKSGQVTFGVYGISSFAGLPNPIVSNVGSAAFSSGAPNTSCTLSNDGNCKLIDCNVGTVEDSPTLSAGDITLTGGFPSPVVLKLKELSGKMVYQPDPALSTSAPVFLGGETIEASASGGEVPAFKVSAVAPNPVQVTGFPVPPTAGGTVELDGGSDLVLGLVSGTEGQVTVFLSVSTANKNLSAYCSEPATSSSLTVKSAIFQKLKAVSDKGALAGFLTRTQDVVVGDWGITLNLPNALQDKDGNPLVSSAQLAIK